MPKTTVVNNVAVANDTPDQIRTYEIVTTDGTLRMSIPESWKVTYAPVAPGAKSYDGAYALRVYELETKQRAIFLNVKSFRDLSIPVQRLFVKTKGSDEWKRDNNGNSSSNSKIEVEREWRLEEND